MDLMGAAMEDRAVPAVGRRVRTPATFMVVDMSLSNAPVQVDNRWARVAFTVVARETWHSER